MTAGGYRIEVLHGVNLDMLGTREPEHYGTLTLGDLERQIEGFGVELGLEIRFFQTNSETEYVERLHSLRDLVDAAVLNPGAWTHYAWAIHDALAIANVPAVEVHLSDVKAREAWRQTSVIADLCVTTVSGQGPAGYRVALERLRQELEGGVSARAGERA